MTQIVININNRQKWNALKTILKAMDIDYTAQDATEKLGGKEPDLLNHALSDKEDGRLTVYTNHRDILGR